MPVFREVAAQLPGRKLLSVPAMYQGRDLAALYGDLSGFEVSYDTHAVLNEAAFAFVCSGTATLEAAIIATPFTLVYKAKAFDYFIGRLLVRLPYVGLANLIRYFAKEEPLHPEFLQHEVTAENLLRSFREFEREKFIDNAVQLRRILKAKQGASANVAQILKG
jgi:lipid-A-disaccharide synthase